MVVSQMADFDSQEYVHLILWRILGQMGHLKFHEEIRYQKEYSEVVHLSAAKCLAIIFSNIEPASPTRWSGDRKFYQLGEMYTYFCQEDTSCNALKEHLINLVELTKSDNKHGCVEVTGKGTSWGNSPNVPNTSYSSPRIPRGPLCILQHTALRKNRRTCCFSLNLPLTHISARSYWLRTTLLLFNKSLTRDMSLVLCILY